MNRILVTGGTGFIGESLADHLRKSRDCEVIAIGSSQVNLMSPGQTNSFFERMGAVSEIYHLAALYKAGGWPVEHPATQFHANLMINANVLEAWARHQPSAKLTSILSYCMYPPHDDPHPEEELWGSEPEEYLFSYAMTKKALLVGHRAYSQEYGLDCTCVVLPTVYGPGDSFAVDSHVMGALVGKFVRATLNNDHEVEVWGSGEQEREFLYIGDAVKGLSLVGQQSREEVLNMGVGGSASIKSIASMIASACDYRGEIRFVVEDRFVGVRKRELDSSKIARILDWKAGTSLEDGIRRTVDWYRERC